MKENLIQKSEIATNTLFSAVDLYPLTAFLQSLTDFDDLGCRLVFSLGILSQAGEVVPAECEFEEQGFIILKPKGQEWVPALFDKYRILRLKIARRFQESARFHLRSKIFR